MGSSTVRRGTASASPVFVITGTSGAGKGTLERALLERIPELELAVSATTRERRPGEQHGREYWFLSEDEFDRKVEGGGFLEWIQLAWGPRSGTLLSEIDRIQAAGRVPLLDLETEGALRVRKQVPGAVTIFVRAPSFAENERRLRDRATEVEAEIEERLRVARAQLARADEFDHVVVNDELGRAVDELEAIVRKKLAAAGTMSAP
ncbi:MAG TPA: guanylate kinase [Gaiellaceae bacterium]|nr:guanylate kinase [Gaiellaceae bacterium]